MKKEKEHIDKEKINKEQINNYQLGGGLPMNKPIPIPTSNLAYYITIELDLHPGEKLTPEELKNTKCIHKRNAIRKSYAELTGKPYVIAPIYNYSPYEKNQQKSQEQKQNQDQNTRRKTKSNFQNYSHSNNSTRRNIF